MKGRVRATCSAVIEIDAAAVFPDFHPKFVSPVAAADDGARIPEKLVIHLAKVLPPLVAARIRHGDDKRLVDPLVVRLEFSERFDVFEIAFVERQNKGVVPDAVGVQVAFGSAVDRPVRRDKILWAVAPLSNPAQSLADLHLPQPVHPGVFPAADLHADRRRSARK